MFTGLIEAIGRGGRGRADARIGFRLRIDDGDRRGARPGDSLAVNGVCLTVVAADDGRHVTRTSPRKRRA